MIVIVAKKNADFYRIYLQKLFPNIYENNQMFFVKTVKTLENIISEYTTEKDQVPILIFTGMYLYGDNTRESEFIINIVDNLKYRRKCVVMVITSETKENDYDKLVFNENEVITKNIFSIIRHKDIEKIVKEKNYQAIRDKVKKLFLKKSKTCINKKIKNVVANT